MKPCSSPGDRITLLADLKNFKPPVKSILQWQYSSATNQTKGITMIGDLCTGIFPSIVRLITQKQNSKKKCKKIKSQKSFNPFI